MFGGLKKSSGYGLTAAANAPNIAHGPFHLGIFRLQCAGDCNLLASLRNAVIPHEYAFLDFQNLVCLRSKAKLPAMTAMRHQQYAGTAGLQGLSTSLARRRAPLGAHGRLLEHINQFCRFQRNRCIESQLAIRSSQKHHQGAHAHHRCSRYSQ